MVAWNNFAYSAGIGASPGCGYIVSPAALFHQAGDIVHLSAFEMDGSGLHSGSADAAAGGIIEVSGVHPTCYVSDKAGIGRVGIGAEPQFTCVVAGDPEGIVAGFEDVEPAVEAASVGISDAVAGGRVPVSRPFKEADQLAIVGAVRIARIIFEQVQVSVPVFCRELPPLS